MLERQEKNKKQTVITAEVHSISAHFELHKSMLNYMQT